MISGNRCGAALIVVLGLLIALGAVAAGVARAVRLEANTVATLRARTVARYAAESGVAIAEWRIQMLLDSVPSPAERAAVFQEWATLLGPLAEVALGDARFGVTVLDLNARIDLNRSDSAAVRGLLAQFTSESRAAEIASTIRAKPLYRLGELALLPGVDDALAAVVAPYVTVWSDGTVNINSAPEPVLAALPALGDAGASNLIARRASGEVFTSAASIQPSPPPVLPPLLVSTVPSRILVVSRGWRLGHPLTHEVQAVYAIMGARLTLQAWQERDL